MPRRTQRSGALTVRTRKAARTVQSRYILTAGKRRDVPNLHGRTIRFPLKSQTPRRTYITEYAARISEGAFSAAELRKISTLSTISLCR